MFHVISILVLIVRLSVTSNAIGISIKTQELYLVVFITRYLDLFTTYYSLYNSLMKILYIGATAYVIYLVYGTEPFKTNYEKSQDSFLHWYFAVIPCAVVSLIVVLYQGFDFFEVLVAFYLIIPLILFPPALLDLFDLARSTCHRTTTDRPAEISRS
jgi:ER lumen protein retaining receptor